MADLTQQISLLEDWKNISTLLSEKEYVGDLSQVSAGGHVYQAVTDDTNPPGNDIVGHPWQATYVGSASPTRRITLDTDKTLWMRVSRGSAILVVSPA